MAYIRLRTTQYTITVNTLPVFTTTNPAECQRELNTRREMLRHTTSKINVVKTKTTKQVRQ